MLDLSVEDGTVQKEIGDILYQQKGGQSSGLGVEPTEVES